MTRKFLPGCLGTGCLLAAILLAASCGGGADGGSGAADAEARYTALARRFGEALLDDNYSAAYGLTSREHYQAGISENAFRALLTRARADCGQPTGISIDINTLNAAGERGDDLGFPDSVPPGSRRARLVVEMLSDSEAYEILYEIWINIIAENGVDRIVTVEIPGFNM